MSNRIIEVKVTVFKMVSGESCKFDVVRPGDQSTLASLTVFSALKADDCERVSDGLKRIFLKSPDRDLADLVQQAKEAIKRELVDELQRAGRLG